MNFLSPLAFALGALLPIIIALYFLKLRREPYPVSSTYLWQTLVRDTAANAPWQRLRPNLLLLLQLLFLAALILALARPFVWGEAAAGSHLILMVDTSASMGATDVKPDRLGTALASASRMAESMPAGGRVTVIEAGRQVRVPVSGATEPGAALAALAALQPGTSGADFASALSLASAMAAREPDSQVVIWSDGGVELPEGVTLPGRVSFVPVGASGNNQAIGVFSLQAGAGGRDLTAFVQVVNYGVEQAQRRLVLVADGQLLAARDLALLPGQPHALTIPGLPADLATVEAHLEGQDNLAADDRAWAVPPAPGKVAVRLVGAGNRFLETAFSLMPQVELSVGPAADDPSSASADQPPRSITIFDTLVPTDSLPAGPLLFIAPPRSTELFSVTGRLDAPAPVALGGDDPLLRYVDLRDVVVQDATRLALPAWGRAVLVDSKSGVPLLITGEPDGRPVLVLAFDLRRSDLPLRVAFPLLVANMLDALAPGGAGGLPASLPAGQPLAVAALPQADAFLLRTPDGQQHKQSLAESDRPGQVVFDQTDRLGLYELDWQDQAGQVQPMGRFAVNLFSPLESDIAPHQGLAVAGAGGEEDQALPRARREWWRPLAWGALGLLVAEWLLAHRGQLARIVNY